MVRNLDSPQPTYVVPQVDQIPDGPEDKPAAGLRLSSAQGPLELQSLVFGAATLSQVYNSEAQVNSDAPFRTVRLALRYGITIFDTAAFYGESEIVLGAVLKELEPEFPRSSYKLITKCGRYDDFDYSAATTRASVQRSLKRLNTTYLDAVYVHDVEWVSENKRPRTDGNPLSALDTEAEAYGLAAGQEGIILGDGDRQVLEAVGELRKLKAEGIVKAVGISGYPLPTLLRLALLVQHTTSEPLDMILSFSHLTLQNATFLPFVGAFKKRARVEQLVAASPFSMGLLTPKPPHWHPAPPKLHEAVKISTRQLADAGHSGGLPDIALGYAYRLAGEAGLPFVAGFSTPAEVHASMKAWRDIKAGKDAEDRKKKEEQVRQLFKEAGYLDWCWESPPPEEK